MREPLAEDDGAGRAGAEAEGNALKNCREVEHPDDSSSRIEKHARNHHQGAYGNHRLHAELLNKLAVEYAYDCVGAAVKGDGQ